MLCRFIKLPAESEAAETILELSEDGGRTKWVRTFGSMRAVSLQEITHNGFIEEAGPFRLVMKIEVQEDFVVHRQIGLKLMKLNVPQIFGPTVVGVLRPGSTDSSWNLKVTISHPLLGLICQYEGEMFAE